jgi:hypothetical protein
VEALSSIKDLVGERVKHEGKRMSLVGDMKNLTYLQGNLVRALEVIWKLRTTSEILSGEGMTARKPKYQRA